MGGQEGGRRKEKEEEGKRRKEKEGEGSKEHKKILKILKIL